MIRHAWLRLTQAAPVRPLAIAMKTFSFGVDPAAPQNKRNHYMVLFFDNSSMDMADQQRSRLEAAKFIDANAGPDRLTAESGNWVIWQSGNWTIEHD